jgi:hypothetical protein
MQPTPGGTILEAENTNKDPSMVETKIIGFTGKGYLGNGDSHSRQLINWTYNAPESGNYILEFRYTLSRSDVTPFDLTINGKKIGEIELWNTGNPGFWVWERVSVNLEKGENSIAILPEKYVMLDHLNIISN